MTLKLYVEKAAMSSEIETTFRMNSKNTNNHPLPNLLNHQLSHKLKLMNLAFSLIHEIIMTPLNVD